MIMSRFSGAALRGWTLVLCAWAIGACASAESHGDGHDEEAAAAAPPSKMLADHIAGEACDSDKDCGNGSCQDEVPAFPMSDRAAEPAPDGFCSFACGINIDCGAGGVCIGAGNNALSFANANGKGLCMKFCDASSPCRDGYSCVDVFGLVVGAEMGSGFSVGSCQPTPSPKAN
jgi:hypothetical protein